MTTKFQIRHVMPFPPEVFWSRVHANADFNDALYNKHLQHRYEVLVNDTATGKWLSKFYPNVKLPDVLAKAAAGNEDSFCLTEDGVLDKSGREWVYRFEVHPSLLEDKVQARGQMVIRPHGQGQCERLVDFEVGVKLFGLGGIVETFVEKTVRRGYDDSGEFLQRYLAGQT